MGAPIMLTWDQLLALGIPEDGNTAYRLGLARARIDARTQAFAAIRLAAELAREIEALALIAPDPYGQELWAKARGVRLAIRAAIGSDKA
jgi:hypothetical protein